MKKSMFKKYVPSPKSNTAGKYILAALFSVGLVACSLAVNSDTAHGKYPLSMFSRTFTARTIGHKNFCLSLKTREYKADEILDQYGNYCCIDPDTKFERISSVLTAKYGWAKDHHLALGIPYVVPGCFCKFYKSWSLRFALDFTVDTTMKTKDEIAMVGTICKKF